jgi:hypothetical protein
LKTTPLRLLGSWALQETLLGFRLDGGVNQANMPQARSVEEVEQPDQPLMVGLWSKILAIEFQDVEGAHG